MIVCVWGKRRHQMSSFPFGNQRRKTNRKEPTIPEVETPRYHITSREMATWFERNHDYTLAYKKAYREKHHEEVRAKARSMNRLLKGVIDLEYHDETLRLWNETHTITDEEERGRAVEAVRERERKLEGEISSLITHRRVETKEEMEARRKALRERREAEREREREEEKAVRIEKARIVEAERVRLLEERRQWAEEQKETLRERRKELRRERMAEAKAKVDEYVASARERWEREGELRKRRKTYTDAEKEMALAWFASRQKKTGRPSLPDELLSHPNLIYRINLWRAEIAKAEAWLNEVD